MLDMTEKATEKLKKQQQEAQNQDPYEPSIWEDNQGGTWQRELLTLFVNNQMRVSLALPLLAVVFALTNLLWISWQVSIGWLAIILAAQGVQLFICKSFRKADNSRYSISDWVGTLAASEFLLAACWSLPLYVFWDTGNVAQHTITIATLMVVIAVRIMIANSYMPIIVAGTGMIAFNIVIRCTLEADPYYIGLGATVFLAEVFFVQLSRSLQKTTRDMLVFKSQREQLISELKEAKAEADMGRQQAEIANVAKSRFLATMSHELRTPLNAIMGFSEILSQEMMGPHEVEIYKEYSGDILHSGSYLLKLINDILDLSRIEAGKQQIADEVVSLVEVIEDCSRLLSLKMQEKNQTLSINLPNGMPKLRGDERAIRQIWINLLSNANKFSDNKTTIKTGVQMHSNGALSIFVTDEGAGMTASEIENALGMFNRGDNAEKRAVEGAGLGLPIVQGLMKLHGGELKIESAKNMGTTISAIFPPARVLSAGQEAFADALQNSSHGQRALISMTS